ncbi:hypothetical protein [Nonomuraea jabiensis]|uniref:Uncharacterized protein n=1 Tax=Nonomuraea jabiensis TaxID=882448 RepID=A0A7W9LGV7_9ACTN|nr:hypothetical protein [Nonomuraea jabiensis]MBB5783253.1 hypothetical protein [Nonomuraea jabiensis]
MPTLACWAARRRRPRSWRRRAAAESAPILEALERDPAGSGYIARLCC